jgi:DNA-binding transcriptional ArsR family regulator
MIAANSYELMAAKAPEAAEFLRQFSNANRMLLLCRIAKQECSVTDIQNDLGIKQPGLSQQLAELRQSGLVKTRRESRLIYYSIADNRVKAVVDLLAAMFCADTMPAAASDPGRALPGPQSERRHEAAYFARLDPTG